MMRNIMNKKLRSYTIIELLVAMMLSCFVVLITYTFYDIISKQFQKKKKFYSGITELSRFHLQFGEEFNRSESILCFDDRIIFIGMKGDSICYTFEDTCILRQWNDASDTVFLESGNFLRSFNTKEVTDGEIDEFSFDVTDKGEIFSFDFIKEASPVVAFDDK